MNYVSPVEKLKQDYQGHTPTPDSSGFFQKKEAQAEENSVEMTEEANRVPHKGEATDRTWGLALLGLSCSSEDN